MSERDAGFCTDGMLFPNLFTCSVIRMPSYFVIIFALFVGAWMLRLFRRKQLKMVYFNDIDSVYPLLLCLLMAFSATVYESMQVFVPETWEHFYFNPTLSPFKVPLFLSWSFC